MIKFIDKPHLPEGHVYDIAIGERYKKVLEKAIISLNLHPIWLKDNEYVDNRLAGHADLMAAHLGGDKIAALEPYCDYFNNMAVQPIDPPETSEYPHDCKLNFCIVGDRIIFDHKAADADVIANISAKKIICRQGYTKCSVCVVDDESIITADAKIAEKASSAGMNVLIVKNGLAELTGFGEGFIGGATFKISKTMLAFTGIIDDVDERRRIENFLDSRGVQPVYLTNMKLFDIGSAIPLTEMIY